jgi:diguanylate cyclase (GGDEF)-like protein
VRVPDLGSLLPDPGNWLPSLKSASGTAVDWDMRVLVAEDDLLSRKHLSALLSGSGYSVTAVPGGAEALSVFEAPDPPQLLVVDWRMPDIDGLTLCRRIRARPGSPYVYVLLVTAEGEPGAVVEGFEAGVDDYVAKPFCAAELLARLRAGERLVRIQRELVEAREALRHQATHDSLTGLLNRSALLSVLERDCARASREREWVGVGIADIDHFKSINDRFGHAAGDAVLVEVARRMSASIRKCDALGRYGGEEFLFVLPNSDVDGARIVAERVRESLACRPIEVAGQAVEVTASFGIASFEPGARDPGAIVEAADAALYEAKAAGRNRVAIRCLSRARRPSSTRALKAVR